MIRLAGVRFRLAGSGLRIYPTPAAFSFGWVGFAFTTLGSRSILGDEPLMPKPSTVVQVVNYSNGFLRSNFRGYWIVLCAIMMHARKMQIAHHRHLETPLATFLCSSTSLMQREAPLIKVLRRPRSGGSHETSSSFDMLSPPCCGCVGEIGGPFSSPDRAHFWGW